MILIADDQPSVRSALRLMLEQQPELSCITEAGDTAELLMHVQERCPEILLLDWELAGAGSDRLVQEMKVMCPRMVIIVLSSHPEARRAALEAGAHGYVNKNEPPWQLCDTIRRFRSKKPGHYDNRRQGACRNENRGG